MVTKKTNILLILLSFTLIFFYSCGKKEFKIKGDIYGAKNQSVALEKADFSGRWITLDSVRTNSNGSFSITREAMGDPEIFRLAYNGKYIYLPIDSTETVILETSADKFGSEYSLSGSDRATLMANFDKDIIKLYANGVPDSPEEVKKSIYTKYIQPDPASIVSYYILTKEINGQPLFNPEYKNDYKYFAAVATGFKEKRPDDPRTSLLAQTSIDAMKKRNADKGRVKEMEATEISLLEIELSDEKGEKKKLSDVAGKGKPTVLLFSLLTDAETPALNRDLAKLLENKGGNFEIYNVSYDPDRYEWRDAAKNLPWVTVFEPDGIYSHLTVDYNISSLPVFFIYNSKGELTDRVFSVEELKKKL